MSKKFHILGGDVAGLVFALEAGRKGFAARVYEESCVAGGRLRPAVFEGWYADSGCCLFNSDDKRIVSYWLDVFGDIFTTPEIAAKIYLDGNYYDYPLNINSLKHLPDELFAKVTHDLDQRDFSSLHEVSDFESYCKKVVGPTIYELFFKNYSEKVWGVSAVELPVRCPSFPVDIKEGRGNFFEGKWFGVPESGCLQAADVLVESVIRSGNSIAYRKKITQLEIDGDRISGIHFADGSRVEVKDGDTVVSCLPVGSLAGLLNLQTSLTYRERKIVGFLIDEAISFADNAGFIYFNQPEFVFNKIVLQNSLSAYGIPDGKSLLFMEVSQKAADKSGPKTDKELIEQIKKQLEELELFNPASLVAGRVINSGSGIPVPDSGNIAEFESVSSKLKMFENLFLTSASDSEFCDDLQTIFSDALNLSAALIKDECEADNKTSDALPNTLESSLCFHKEPEVHDCGSGGRSGSFHEDIKYLRKWADKVKAVALKLRRNADEQGGLAAFTIGCTTKLTDGMRPYNTPVRSVSEGFVGGVVVYTQTQGILACKMVDGIVDSVLVDAEKKLPLLMDIDDRPYKEFNLPYPEKYGSHSSVVYLEVGDLSSACSSVLKKSDFFEYKSNDMTVEGIWHYLSATMKGLSGRKVAIVGGGNIGFKLAVKLVESGCNVQFVRRDVSRGLLLSNAVNVIKPPATMASATYNSDPVKACFFCDAVLGCTNGKPAVTTEMVKVMKQDGVLIDVGKGSLFPKAVESAVCSGIQVLRFDVSAAVDGMVSTIERNRSYSQCIGRIDIGGGVFIVSGGYLGADGDIAVDNYENPTQIFGVCNGAGDFKSSYSDCDEKNLETVRKKYLIGENGFKQ